MDLGLKDKVALVTGSTRGIGRAIAERLAAEGARVALNGSQPALAQSLATEVGAARYYGADVTDAQACTALAQSIERDFGRLDILVCNVGSGASVPAGAEDAAEWQRMLELNLFSATNMVGAASRLLRQSAGAVVCVSSICGMAALGCPIAYAGAKAALNSYVRNAARGLGADNVRINAIAPGNILFPGSVWERKLSDDRESVSGMLARDVALRRLGTAEEIADFTAFLASPRSGFATGAVFVVDGGQLRS
jgi:3-oxoacyl-[acyl-carrier protein] reductase